MTKRKLIAIVVIGLMVVAGAFYPLYADVVRGGGGQTFAVDLPVYADSGGSVSFELAADFPEVGDRLMVYKVKPPEVTPEKVAQMGRRLGFQGEAEVGTDMMAMIDESSGRTRQLSVWTASGAVDYGFSPFMDKLYPDTPPTLPSEEEAKEIATQFLAQAGLLPPGAHVSEVLEGGRCGGDGQPSYLAHLLVRFTWEIDGVPATWTKFAVRIGDGGEVVQLVRVYREVEPYKEVSIRSPQKAYQDLLAGKGSYAAPSDSHKVVVEKVSLAYWMEPAPIQQEYVIPVYEFKGKCLDGEGNYLEDFTGWCQATS
jgi:hypothetical protein